MRINEIKQKVMGGSDITKSEAMVLLGEDLEELCRAANDIRMHFCGDAFDLCSIINGKSGRCPEDCKYCAQSAHYNTDVSTYPLMETERLVQAAIHNEKAGILRFSIVTSGKKLSDSEVDQICESIDSIRNKSKIALCASMGLLTKEQFVKLRMAGVTRYHNNLETSRRFFPEICTTHSYDDKIKTIRMAQEAGLYVCSGGIMGLGETMEDRIDMALELRGLGIRSVPVNVLNPIPGTPLENRQPLSMEEIRRITAVYRFILPDSILRMAGGRSLMKDNGRMVFMSGANGAITQNMLTTTGSTAEDDRRMAWELGFEVKCYE